MTQVRALVLESDRSVSLRDRPKPLASGECLIRVTAAGICGTDLELLRGYAGFSGVPGHEFVGVVEEADAPDAGWIGRRVVGEITVGCGRCPGCRAAGRGHCDNRTVLGIRGRDGAFAEYLTLPSANLHAVPDSMDDVTAVFVEPTAAACRVAEQVAIGPGLRAAVVGAGRLGFLIAQVLRGHGADVLLVARNRARHALATRLDLEAVTVDSVASLARRFDLVVDATGAPAGFAEACALVRPRGTVVVKSTIHGDTPVALSPLVVDEVTVIGSRCGPFPAALEALTGGRVQVGPLVAGIYPLEQFSEAFEVARAGLKVILTPA
ncbi:MAG TPA: alcohol dehydrogenase catalytic domain-containing protein [Vicinamibacterales bacterium]|nr:alcohol dehydrogenase catalytic domain-containing protein [Vicinamibacterales bacterium]